MKSFLFISPPFGNYFPESLFNTFLSFKKCDNRTQSTNDTNYHFKSIVGSFTLDPRDGLLFQVLKTLRYSNEHNGWVNKIGLRNKGIDWAINKYYKEPDVVVSVAVMDVNEIDKLVSKIPEDMNIEVNISCPNVNKSRCIEETHKFINNKREWCSIKLSPIISKEDIDTLYSSGWRTFHCSNTLPVKEGGLSGPSVIPYSLDNIRYIKSKYSDSVIVSGGGIQTVSDIKTYEGVGSSHFSMASLMFNPINFGKLLFNL